MLTSKEVFAFYEQVMDTARGMGPKKFVTTRALDALHPILKLANALYLKESEEGKDG